MPQQGRKKSFGDQIVKVQIPTPHPSSLTNEQKKVLKSFEKSTGTSAKSGIFDKLKEHDKNFNEIGKIKFSEHHYSHAASAFFPSPFEEAIILTLDGVGEWATSTIALGKSNKISIIKKHMY